MKETDRQDCEIRKTTCEVSGAAGVTLAFGRRTAGLFVSQSAAVENEVTVKPLV